MPELTPGLITLRLVTLVAGLLLLGLALLLVLAEYRRARRLHLLPLLTSLVLLVIYLGLHGTLSASLDLHAWLFSPFVASLLGLVRIVAVLSLLTYAFKLTDPHGQGPGNLLLRVMLFASLGTGLVLGAVYQLPALYGIPTGAQVSQVLFAFLLLVTAGTGTWLLWPAPHRFGKLLGFTAGAFAVWAILDLVSGSVMELRLLGELIAVLALAALAVRQVTEELTTIAVELHQTTVQWLGVSRSLRQLQGAAGTLLRAGSIKACLTALLDLLNLSFGFRQAAIFLLNPAAGQWECWKLSPLTGQAVKTGELPLERRQFLTEAILAGGLVAQGHGTPDQDFLTTTGFPKQPVLIPLVAPRVSFGSAQSEPVRQLMQRGSTWKSDPCWLADKICAQGLGNYPQRLDTCRTCAAFEPLGAIITDLKAVPEEQRPALEALDTLGAQASLALRDLLQIEELATDIRFRTAALDPLPMGIVLLGPDGRITALNQQVRQIAGLQATTWRDKPIGEVPLTTNPKQLQETITRFIRQPSSEPVELAAEIIGPQGRRECLIHLQPLARHHVLTGILLTLEDRTETLELQRTVMQQERFAAMGQLAMGIAHEVNNPIAGVSGLLQMLAKRLPPEAAEQRPIQTAIQDLKRASDTIRNLLQFARPRPAQLQPVDLNALVTELLDLQAFHPLAQEVTFHTDLAPELSLAQTDRESIAQVVTNLTLNALQAMQGRGTLTYGTYETATRVILAVRDTGPGIPPDLLPRIFEPFFTTKKAGQGTGLGLSLCDMILGGLGGDLAVVSGPEGTEFLLLLPKARQMVPAARRWRPETPATPIQPAR